MATKRMEGVVRDSGTGAGQGSVGVSIKKVSDGSTVTSTTTDNATDVGYYSRNHDVVGYPGPVYESYTFGTTTKVRDGRVHGQLAGLIWADDVPDVFAALGIGVVPGIGGDLAVSASGVSMAPAVAAGMAIVKDGLVYLQEAASSVTLSTADATNPRIDRIVLRLTREGQSDQGKIVPAKIDGTPAASPSAPALTQTSATWDFPLAQVRVNAGVTTIAADKVTDERTFWVPGAATDIQAAIDAVAARGGGTVFVGPGTFDVQLTMKTGVHLRGAGIGATVLRLPSATNGTVITGNGAGALFGTNGTGGIHSWSISDLTIDGNKANQSSGGKGIYAYGYGFQLSRLRVKDCFANGITTEWSNSAASPGNDAMEASVIDVKVHDSGARNIDWNGPHDSIWQSVIAYSAAAEGVYVGAKGSGLLAFGCHSWGSTQTYAWNILGSGCHLIGCEGEGASVNQLRINANDCAVTGGSYFGAGAAVPVGIHLDTCAGYRIETKILNCTSGAIKYTADAGLGWIEALVYQASGAAESGTPSATSYRRIRVFGGGTGDVGLAIAEGGTGATNAAGARTNLGLDSGGAGDIWVNVAGDTITGAVVMSLTTGEAFLVRKTASGTKIININTAAATEALQILNGASFSMYSGDYVGLVFNVSGAGKASVSAMTGIGSAPSAAAGAALGSSPGAITVTGADVSFTVSGTAGTSTVAGVVWTITFVTPKANNTYRSQIQAHNAVTADANLYVSARSTTQLTISCRNAPTASQNVLACIQVWDD